MMKSNRHNNISGGDGAGKRGIRVGGSGVEITPLPIPSGFHRMKVYILYGLLYLTGVYMFSSYVLHPFLSNKIGILPPLAKEYCTPGDDSSCITRTSLFAFEVASFQALFFCGILGFYTWHITKAPFTKIPQTPEGRLFGRIAEAEYLTSAAVTFQLWDLVVSLLIPEQCTIIMIGHHFMAALVAWYGLNNQVRNERIMKRIHHNQEKSIEFTDPPRTYFLLGWPTTIIVTPTTVLSLLCQ